MNPENSGVGVLEGLIATVEMQADTVKLLLDNVARLHRRVVDLEKLNRHKHNGEAQAPCWDCGREDVDPIHSVEGVAQ